MHSCGIFFLISCSSIEVLRDSNFTINPPKIPLTDSVISVLDTRDCRLETAEKEKLSFYFLDPIFPEYIDKEWKNLFFDFQNKLYNTQFSNILYQSIDVKDEKFNDFCKKNKLDLIVKTTLKLFETHILVVQDISDSYTQKLLKVLKYRIDKNYKKFDRNILDLYYYKNTISKLPVSNTRTFNFIDSVDFSQFQKFIYDNLHAKINIYSSDRDLDIYLNDQLIGKPPILDHSIKAGNLKVTYKKISSKLARDQYLNIRGGSYQNIIDPQPEIFKNTTLYLMSYPENLPVYIDSLLFGYTPLLLDGTIPGERNLSISKKLKTRIFIKPGIDNILIRPEKLLDAQKEVSIWDLNLSDKSLLNPNCGICFDNIPDTYLNDWISIYSYPLEVGRIQISGELFSSLERGIGDIAIGILDEKFNGAYYFSEDKMSLFNFYNSNKSIADFIFKKNLDYSISFLMEIDSISQKINFYSDNKKLYSFNYKIKSGMRLYIAAKSKIYSNIKIIKKLNIIYD